MLNSILIWLCIFAGWFAFDWLISTRIAAYATSSDYHYRFSSLRFTSAVLICIYLIFVYENNDASKPSMIMLLIAIIAFIVYASIVVRDVRMNLVKNDDA